MDITNCELCGKDLTGELEVSEGELTDGTPVVHIDSTPDRNWICCNSCNAVVCRSCCKYPDSGYCDRCIEKYQLYDYLVSVGSIQEKGGCECL